VPGDPLTAATGHTREADTSVDVCLVTMPYCHITRPSLPLGVLKACLRGTGITCAVEYANLRFAELVGIDALRIIETARNEQLIGEWTFSAAAFPGHKTAAEDTIGRDTIDEALRRRPEVTARLADVLEVWNRARDLAPAFVDDTARRILARRPRIVGCTSTFEQQTASLALLRRVKALDPSVITLLGGANCEAEMGWAAIQEFPWVDFVVSGEADALFAPLCRLLLDKGAAVDVDLLPHGVLGAAHVKAETYAPGRAKPPRAVVEGMDGTPVPDFDDYFAALERSSLRPAIVPALPLETSRGCWWGQKSQCTFCGLNGEGMGFRAKSPARVLAELDSLASRYGIRRFQVADNILDMHQLRTVMPALAEAGAPYEFFYEIKANLRREQVAALAQAGVTKVQPGIEALHDDLLKLMAKGNSTAINLQLLKHVREFGIHCVWLVLVGFPGEDDRWHEEVAAWLPLICHLQPPSAVVHVRYDRFSVYHQDPARYGLRLVPYPAYAAVYPSAPERLQDLAYFFCDADGPTYPADTPGIAALRRAIRVWQELFTGTLRPVLCVTDEGEGVEVFDTRPCASERRTVLTGLDAQVYRACEPPVSRTELRARCAGAGGVTAGDVDAAVARLASRKLVLEVHGRLVALGVPGDVPLLRGREEAPGGWVEGANLPLTVAVDRALAHLRALTA